MAKHRSQKRRRHSKRGHSKRGTRRHRQHGGDLAGNPPSAWGWGLGTLGDGMIQFRNALMLQPGENLGAVQSNAIVPVGNLNAQTNQGNIGPDMKGNIPGQAGGKKRKSRAKHGGNLLAIAEQAAVPVALIAMNNTLGTRRRRSRRR